MNIIKEKLLKRINQHITNAEESIIYVLKSKNYHVANDLKNIADFLKIVVWEIENGIYDEKPQAPDPTESPSR